MLEFVNHFRVCHFTHDKTKFYLKTVIFRLISGQHPSSEIPVIPTGYAPTKRKLDGCTSLRKGREKTHGTCKCKIP